MGANFFDDYADGITELDSDTLDQRVDTFDAEHNAAGYTASVVLHRGGDFTFAVFRDGKPFAEAYNDPDGLSRISDLILDGVPESELEAVEAIFPGRNPARREGVPTRPDAPLV